MNPDHAQEPVHIAAVVGGGVRKGVEFYVHYPRARWKDISVAVSPQHTHIITPCVFQCS